MINTKQKAHQHGISSFIVMMMLVLALISVLSAQRVGLLNEAFMGSDSDAQRAFAAAEALLQDAKLDVKGVKTAVNGTTTPCNAGGVGCRPAGNITFPQKGNGGEYGIPEIRNDLGVDTCKEGICAPATPIAPFWLNNATFTAMKAQAATYGQFTGASPAGNNILDNKSWYWVEVFRYNVNEPIAQMNLSSGTKPPLVNPKLPYVFRITAISEGQKSGSLSVLQTYYIPSVNTGK